MFAYQVLSIETFSIGSKRGIVKTGMKIILNILLAHGNGRIGRTLCRADADNFG